MAPEFTELFCVRSQTMQISDVLFYCSPCFARHVAVDAAPEIAIADAVALQLRLTRGYAVLWYCGD